MTDIEAYLDQACAGLKINPAQADDIRDELRSHLEESLSAQGVALDNTAAVREALAGFGDPAKLAEFLGLVHQGEPSWRLRFKGLIIGLTLGLFLSWLGQRVSVSFPLLRFFLSPLGSENANILLWINCLGLGGLIGLLAVVGKPLLLGWWLGFFAWTIELAVFGITSMIRAGNLAPPEFVSSPSLLLLTPLLGGCFGLLIALSARGLSYLISRLRPEIR